MREKPVSYTHLDVYKRQALRCLHFPRSMDEVYQATRTLKYEEFLKFHLVLEMIHRQQTETVTKKAKQFDAEQVYALANHLSFAMTPDQFKAVRDILADMGSDKIMYRLIQGDAVSYTHLDVYKRQDRRFADHYYLSADHPGGCPDRQERSRSVSVLCRSPVSYTHLDVYKRQVKA